MTAVPRNAPCPCGSGRRYKECHGALVEPPASAEDESRNVAMAAALAAQKAGDFGAAIVAYRDVLAEAPDHFDALHMLGVVMLQINQLQDAETLIARAASLRPGVAAVHQNLAIVRAARRTLVEQESICRSVLPRLARLCVEVPPALLHGVGPADAVGIVFAGNELEIGLGQAINTTVIASGATVTSGTVTPRVPPAWPAVDEAWLAALDGVDVIVVGLDAPLGEWPLTARARSTALLVTRDAPCLLHDRLRELSGQGRWRVSLVTLDAKLAAESMLPIHLLREADWAVKVGSLRIEAPPSVTRTEEAR